MTLRTCTKHRARPGRHARGVIGVALVGVLVIVQVTVVVTATTSGTDAELTALRLDTAQAFYAAEAGVNIAVREVIAGVDADGDGTLGSIDGVAITPRASVVVSRVDTPSMTITSAGTAGLARRTIAVSMQ